MKVDESGEMEMEVHILQEQFELGESQMKLSPEVAISTFQKIFHYQGQDANEDVVLRIKENAIYQLGTLYTTLGKGAELSSLLSSCRPFFLTIPKAKTGKIVRTIIDMVSRITSVGVNTLSLQHDLCMESITWCNNEKHTFLRQRIEARLTAVLFEQGHFQMALDLVTRLLKEIKKLDDKPLLVELHLIESRLHHALRNTPKAKAALTAARSIANSVYIVPKTQAYIDMMSGTLHAEERDYKTSYSYFYEAFEAFNQLNDREEALPALKYMLLSRIANGDASDVQGTINSKNGIKYAGLDLDAMLAVAKAHEKRSLEEFQSVKKSYDVQLVQDPLIRRHLELLYAKLLDANLLKIIHPFSVVQVSHVASLINLPVEDIEMKLSQMILDGKFHGILDQGKGHLLVYEQTQEDEAYKCGLELIDNVDQVVGSLFRRAEHVTA